MYQIQNEQTIEKINKIKIWIFVKINTTDITFSKMIKKKRKHKLTKKP